MENKTENINVKTEENEYKITFKKPYVFEGKTYKDMDLSAIEDITANDLYSVSKRFSTEQYISPRPEADPRYCALIAAIVIKQPDVFFDNLPAKEIIKVRNVVSSFFLEED